MKRAKSFRVACAVILLTAFVSPTRAADDQNVAKLKQELRQKEAEIKALKARLRLYEAGKEKKAPAPAARTMVAARPQASTASASAAAAPALGTLPAPKEKEKESRALDRALVSQGAMVLPRWVGEITPGFAYVHSGRTSSNYIRDAYVGSLGLSMGLPFLSQIGVSVPYAFRYGTVAGHTSGFGNVSLSLSKQLFYQKGELPSMIASLGWLAPTGVFGLNDLTGGNSVFDTHVFSVGLTAVRADAPLVFVGGVSWAKALSGKSSGLTVDPGDSYGGSFGVNLVATPDTTLFFGLNLNHVGTPTIDGVRVRGWEPIVGTANVGLGTYVFGKQYVNIGAQFRVTGSAPDFEVSFSVPMRF